MSISLSLTNCLYCPGSAKRWVICIMLNFHKWVSHNWISLSPHCALFRHLARAARGWHMGISKNKFSVFRWTFPDYQKHRIWTFLRDFSFLFSNLVISILKSSQCRTPHGKSPFWSWDYVRVLCHGTETHAGKWHRWDEKRYNTVSFEMIIFHKGFPFST